ncbi:MAG: hypothetical protein WBM90_00710 [Acidimicrobiia bacterium]
MPTIEKTIEIDVPYGDVYEFVANDVERLPEFVPIVKDVFDVSPGPIGEGTTFKEHTVIGPMYGSPTGASPSWSRRNESCGLGTGRTWN